MATEGLTALFRVVVVIGLCKHVKPPAPANVPTLEPLHFNHFLWAIRNL